MRPRKVRVWLGEVSAYASGFEAKELVLASGGSPTWSRVAHAWAFAPHRISDVIAWAEHSGYLVDWLGDVVQRAEQPGAPDRDVLVARGLDVPPS